MAKKKASKFKGDIVLWCNYPNAPFQPTETIEPTKDIHSWIDENFFEVLKLNEWREEFSKAKEYGSVLDLDKIRYDIGALLYMIERDLVMVDDKGRHCIKVDLTVYTGLTRPIDQLKLSNIMVEILTLDVMENSVLHVFTNDERFPNTLRYTAFKNPEFVNNVAIITPDSNKTDRKVLGLPRIIGVTKDGRYYDKEKYKLPAKAKPVEFPNGYFDTQLDRLLEMM